MLLVSAVALALLAGCLTRGPDTSERSDPTVCDVAGKDGDVCGPRPPTTPTVLNASSTSSKRTELSYSGKTSLSACPPQASARYHCKLLLEGAQQIMPVPAKGTPFFLALNVTWQAVTPATDTLLVLLFHKENASWIAKTGDPVKSGASPLSLAADLAKYGPTVELAVGVFHDVGASGADAELPQDFVVKGAIWTMRPSPS